MEKDLKILFTDEKEWYKKEQELYFEIKKSVNHWIDEREDDYDSFFYFKGLTPRQSANIQNDLTSSLNKLTNNYIWSKQLSFYIVTGIDSFIKAIKENFTMQETMYVFTKEKLSSIVYTSIKNQLENEYLIDIPLYKCIKCNKIEDIRNDEQLCDDCREQKD